MYEYYTTFNKGMSSFFLMMENNIINKKRFNVILDEDLILSAKKRGARLRKSVSEMIREQFYNWYLEENILAEDSNGETEVSGRLE